MLSRLKTAATATGSATGQGSDGNHHANNSGKWGSRRPSRTTDTIAEKDQFRVQQQGYYVRGALVVDIFQARGVGAGTPGDRNLFCAVLVDREKVAETPVATRTTAPIWNHAVKVPHENIRRAADMNVWPVPYQPLTVQVWDRSTTSDTLVGTARVAISEKLGNADSNGWHRLVGTGDQTGDTEACGKIRVKARWESEAFSSNSADEPRFTLQEVFGPEEKDYRHLYYGGLRSTVLSPPAGEEILLELMSGISRHDVTVSGNAKGVEGTLVLTELRLLYLPDVFPGTGACSFLEFHTVQIYLAAVRSFSHRGLEGGERLLSITTRDGRTVHFRMPAVASSARCGALFEAECSRRRRSLIASGSGQEELWKRGLWGAGSSELWMERLADEIRWRRAQCDFVALWHKVCRTARTKAGAALSNAVSANTSSAAGVAGSAHVARGDVALGAAASEGAAPNKKGDAADGFAALERDLERVGVPGEGLGGSSYASVGRQMWEFKSVNKGYSMTPTYPQALAFPSSISSAQVVAAAPQRSRNRVPALVWLHPASKAPLVRSSQPMAGMTAKVLSEDIFLLKQIRVTLDATKISIVDARSLLNAKANQMAGRGYEDVNDIGRDVATLGFMNIDNIHSVRDSLAAFCSAAQAPGPDFYHAVGASGWLRHLSQIMKGAAFVADELQRGVAVLVHCSDGWDRTAQLTALAQLYLDPYYRTLAGFEVLVEKEWCSFGHMFGLRAHSDSATESSPVFLQWLDAVWQLVRQYPSSFEFTGHYLERLVEAVYSACFLNFAGNCERDRKERLRDLQEAGDGAVSIFTYLREYISEGSMTAPMLNALYRSPGQTIGDSGSSASRAVDVLRPCCELQGLELWQAVYMRDSLVLHHRENQLTVEQGLRLQVFDFQRRIKMVEAQVDRLPSGLKQQLRASAAAMSNPDWAGHRRLADLASSEQEGAATSESQASSRGRTQTRTARSGTHDDLSRSRSRSFSFGLRRLASSTTTGGGGGGGGSGGERRRRWASQDSDQLRGREDTELDEEAASECPTLRTRANSSATTAASGAVQDEDEDEEVDSQDGEDEHDRGDDDFARHSRSRSFFAFGGRMRGRQGSRAAHVAGAGDADGRDHKTDAGSTRQQKSTAAGGRYGRDGVRRSRIASFGGDRPAVAPTSDRTPDEEEDLASTVTFDKEAPASRPDRKAFIMKRSLSSVDSSATSDGHRALGSARGRWKGGWGRDRTGSTEEALEDKDSARRPRAVSAAAAVDAGQMRPSITAPQVKSSSTRSVQARGREKDGKWPFSRKKRDASDAKKGLFHILQRRLGGSQKPSTPQPVPIQGRRPRPTATAAAANTVHMAEMSVADTGRGAAVADAAAGRDAPVDEADSRSEGAANEQLRQMRRTIALLEVELIINNVVDRAWLQAQEREEARSADFVRGSSFSKDATTPETSSNTEAHALDLTAATPIDKPTFFGLWGSGGSGYDKRRHTDVVDDGKSASMAIWSGRKQEAASADAGGRKTLDGTGSDGRETELEEEGFFQVLRRKLFEADKYAEQVEAGATRSSRKTGDDLSGANIEANAGAAPSGTGVAMRVEAADGPGQALTTTPPPPPPLTIEVSSKFTSAGKTQDRSGVFSVAGATRAAVYSSARARPTRSTSAQSVAAPAAETRAVSGTGRPSPIRTRASPARAAVKPLANPDAGAGGMRSVGRSRRVASVPDALLEPALVEEAAAKFGLVRMVTGAAGQ